MKTIKSALTVIILIALTTGCKKQQSTPANQEIIGCMDKSSINYNPNATKTGPETTCRYNGSIIFYYDGGLSEISIDVTINGQVGRINTFYSKGIPVCGTKGCATFVIESGIYEYTAISTTGTKWSGKVVVGMNDCGAQVLQ